MQGANNTLFEVPGSHKLQDPPGISNQHADGPEIREVYLEDDPDHGRTLYTAGSVNIPKCPQLYRHSSNLLYIPRFAVIVLKLYNVLKHVVLFTCTWHFC